MEFALICSSSFHSFLLISKTYCFLFFSGVDNRGGKSQTEAGLTLMSECEELRVAARRRCGGSEGVTTLWNYMKCH